jgi:hypothetical protein
MSERHTARFLQCREVATAPPANDHGLVLPRGVSPTCIGPRLYLPHVDASHCWIALMGFALKQIAPIVVVGNGSEPAGECGQGEPNQAQYALG